MDLIFQQYLERYARLRFSASATINFKRTVTLFEESGLELLTARDFEIEEWLTSLQLAPRTRRLHLQNLSAAYNYAVRRGMLQVAPTETVRLPREPDEEPRILENHELRQILRNAQTERQELLAMTLIYTGMRRSEIRNLMWEDVSPESIRVKHGKGGKLRHVPLHPALAEVFLTHSTPKSPYIFPGRGGPLSQTGVGVELDKLRGDIECSFHDFRRTVATSLIENGVLEMVVDKIMGWAPRTVGQRHYIRTADTLAQEAILKLYANDPIFVCSA